MSNQKDHEYQKKLESCYKLVQQSSAKGGIRAVKIAEKMDIHRTTVHGYLNSLQYMGKVYSNQGFWKTTTGEPTIKPEEKEIEIVLPIPKDEVIRLAFLEDEARDWEKCGMKDKDNSPRILLEKFKEARTIKIKGKNVDDLNLDKIAVLIEQASKNSSKFNLKGILRKKLRF